MAPHRLTEIIPESLAHYVVKQDATLYTPIDHAVWRFILKISQHYFKDHAHRKYLDGLAATGISTDRIPLIEEMDAKLRQFGWRAVAVSGFIPPAAFMEFLALGVLPIACDMRSADHLAYTPAPDIVHEAAGHAPIIADPEYRKYLLAYGEISRRAITSLEDMAVYHAIRTLSDTKERPGATESEISAAQAQLDAANSAVSFDSEAALLSRMGWWTFEYGLIGPLGAPKIYGAGLLSSVGESYHCLSAAVRKIPFSIDCIHQTYDITKPQPQLFVAPDFETLQNGLEELAARMAFRTGGSVGLERAVQARTVTTVQLACGIQVSGVLSAIESDAQGKPVFLRWSGPCQLAEHDKELAGHGPERHAQGFSLPLGEWSISPPVPIEQTLGAQIAIQYASGFRVVGTLQEIQAEGRILVLDDCTVTHPNGKKVYEPAWGTFDLVLSGSQIPSVFGGPADRAEFQRATGGHTQEPGQHKTNLTPSNRALNALYARARTEGLSQDLVDTLARDYPHDWLLRYELLELAQAASAHAATAQRLRQELAGIATRMPQARELIERGLEVL